MSDIFDDISQLPPDQQHALEIFAQKQTERSWNYFRNKDIETYTKLVIALIFLGFRDKGISLASSRRSSR